MKTDNQPTDTPLTVKALQDFLEKLTSEKKRWQADNLHLVRIVEEDELWNSVPSSRELPQQSWDKYD